MRLREALRGKLTTQELPQVVGSFDIIGTIAKLEIPPALRKKEKVIAATMLELNPAIKTVVRKAAIHSGEYRLQKVKVIAGEKTKETTHKENGVAMLLDIEKCYFSPRLSSERLRIAKQVRKGENVLVMFSGVGVYPLVIAKHSKAAHIWGIELNPTAHRYALENVARNKANNVTVLRGDVRKIVPKLLRQGLRFDRIVMPLPKEAEKFLPLALKAVKKGGTVHLYGFLGEGEIPGKAKELVAGIAQCKVLRVVKCGAYAARVYRVCIDVKVN